MGELPQSWQQVLMILGIVFVGYILLAGVRYAWRKWKERS